jgi:hypothetical protein
LKGRCLTWMPGWHAWAKSMVWFSLNVSDV